MGMKIENGNELCILVRFTFFAAKNQVPQIIIRMCRVISIIYLNAGFTISQCLSFFNV